MEVSWASACWRECPGSQCPEVTHRPCLPTVGVGPCRGLAPGHVVSPDPQCPDFTLLLSDPYASEVTAEDAESHRGRGLFGSPQLERKAGPPPGPRPAGVLRAHQVGADLTGGAGLSGGGSWAYLCASSHLRLMSNSPSAAVLGGVGPAPPQALCGPFCFGGAPPGRGDGASCLLWDLGLSLHPGDICQEPTLGPGPTAQNVTLLGVTSFRVTPLRVTGQESAKLGHQRPWLHVTGGGASRWHPLPSPLSHLSPPPLPLPSPPFCPNPLPDPRPSHAWGPGLHSTARGRVPRPAVCGRPVGALQSPLLAPAGWWRACMDAWQVVAGRDRRSACWGCSVTACSSSLLLSPV